MTTPFATHSDMLAALAPLASPGGAHDVLSTEADAIVNNIFDISRMLPVTEEQQNRLIGHVGLRGELWNGSAMIFRNYLRNVFNHKAAPEALIIMGIEEYAHAFLAKPSQLAKITQIDTQPETSGEALERCYIEISRWIENDVADKADELDDFNRTLVFDRADKIKTSLAHFNNARLSLKNFAENASAYLNLNDTPYQEMDRQKHSMFLQINFA